MKTTIYLLQGAGLLHVGLLCAGACLPRVVDFKSHLAVLPDFLRRLFYVYYGFVGGLIVAFGAISFFLAGPLASGGPMARALLLLMSLFWGVRLVIHRFVFDLRPYLTNPWRRAGYRILDVTFLYLPVVYAYAFWRTF